MFNAKAVLDGSLSLSSAVLMLKTADAYALTSGVHDAALSEAVISSRFKSKNNRFIYTSETIYTENLISGSKRQNCTVFISIYFPAAGFQLPVCGTVSADNHSVFEEKQPVFAYVNTYMLFPWKNVSLGEFSVSSVVQAKDVASAQIFAAYAFTLVKYYL